MTSVCGYDILGRGGVSLALLGGQSRSKLCGCLHLPGAGQWPTAASTLSYILWVYVFLWIPISFWVPNNKDNSWLSHYRLPQWFYTNEPSRTLYLLEADVFLATLGGWLQDTSQRHALQKLTLPEESNGPFSSGAGFSTPWRSSFGNPSMQEEE